VSEVAVSRKASEPTSVSRPTEWFRPMLPLSNLWGVSPASMMRELNDEMDRMFRGVSTGSEIQAWAPAMDQQRCNGNW